MNRRLISLPRSPSHRAVGHGETLDEEPGVNRYRPDRRDRRQPRNGRYSRIGMLAIGWSFCVVGLAAPPVNDRQLPSKPLERRLHLMGTVCTLVHYAEDRAAGGDRLESFVRILESTERQLSSWRSDSSISRVNRHPVGQSLTLEPDLCRLFDDLFFWNRATQGAFDPAIGAWIEAWDLRGRGRLPNAEALQWAEQRAGMARLLYQPSFCQLTRLAEAALDAGAFGKGEALDRVRSHAAGQGVRRWMVDLGGQIAVQGAPPGQEAWTIRLTHPVRRQQPLLSVAMDSGSLATSGGATRDLQVNGRRVGHIIDPRSGQPASFRGSVSVWHPSALVADILSTALYVMGPHQGLDWAGQRGLAVCFLEMEDSEVRIRPSPAFTERFLGVFRE